jgi:uncharacterized protein YjbI with pentapeptide repeats
LVDEITATSDVAHGDDAPSAKAAETAAVAFAAKAKELEALRTAVVDAGSVGAGLWFSYLFVLLYLAIAVGSVTHRDLLFENPVKLPFLNADLPVTVFFVVGPGLFLIVHAYVLLHLVPLAENVGAFRDELQTWIVEEDTRAPPLHQLPSNIFVQFLAGPNQAWAVRSLRWVVVQASLVFLPLALLVLFQLKFLPYHSEIIAWWQRGAVVLDLALLLMLWTKVAGPKPRLLKWSNPRRAGWALVGLVPLLLVFGVANFPGEFLHETLPSPRFIPAKFPPWKSQGAEANQTPGWVSLQELLVAGDVDYVSRRPKSLWSNRLVLPNIDVIDHAKFDNEDKIAALPETISLRGRQLEGAVLLSATLRKADFTGAHLQGAILSDADLREAKFGCGEVGSEPQCVDLRGARLDRAQLQGAWLPHAQLQGANLANVQLQGTMLESAQLQGAWLPWAQLQGARLMASHLEGATLTLAHLAGAELTSAHLEGALLYNAQLQGALLDDAQLKGAWLDDAQLQGASLRRAQLQESSLVQTQLQGALLDEVQLRGAWVSHVFVWRAGAPKIEEGGAFVVAPETLPIYDCYADFYPAQPRLPPSHEQAVLCPWSAGSFAALKNLIEREVPEVRRDWIPPYAPRDAALNRITTLDPAKPLREEVMAKAWADLAQPSPSGEIYQTGLAASLRSIGCEASGAPYVIGGLARHQLNIRFASGSPQLLEVATAFLDEPHCPGSRGLSDDENFRLQMLRDQPATAPAPTTPK